MSERVPRVVTIAGTDPTGGAGAQADIKAITLAGGFALNAVTAIVSQNTTGVQQVYTPDASVLASQLESISDDVNIDAVKIGMLANSSYIATVSAWLKKVKPPVVVLDPVMIATSGDKLLDPDAEDQLREMLTQATIITPNIPELEVLARKLPGTITNYEDALKESEKLAKSYGCMVMVKGGHLEDPYISNALVSGAGVVAQARSPKVDTKSTHGTGCSISSALATRVAIEIANLTQNLESCKGTNPGGITDEDEATGNVEKSQSECSDTAKLAEIIRGDKPIDEQLKNAFKRALKWSTAWIYEAITHAESLHIGHGNGPIDHSHRMRRLESSIKMTPWRCESINLPYLEEPITWDSKVKINAHVKPAGPWTQLLWDISQETMQEMLRLPFLTQLREGTLGEEEFTAYLCQDALYLSEYGRAMAALAARTRKNDDLIFWSHSSALAIEEECSLHRNWLSGHVAGEHSRLGNLPKSPVTAGYTDFLLARAAEDYTVGCAAVLPCFWLYCELGKDMADANYPGHAYEEWLSTYGDDSFTQSTQKAISIVEVEMAHAGVETRERAVRAYLGAAEWEREFFGQAERLVLK